MEILLFISMVFLFILSLILSKYDFSHPSVLFSSVWCVSSFFCLFSYNYSKEKIEFLTVFILVIFNLLFVISSNLISYKKKNKVLLILEINKNLKNKMISIILVNIILYFLASAYLLKDIFRMANLVDVPKNFFDNFRLARYADTIANIPYKKLSTYFLRLNIANGIVSMYFASLFFFNHRKQYKWFGLVSIISVCFTIFSCARNQVIMLVASFLFLILYNFYSTSLKKNKTVFKYAMIRLIIAGVFSLVIFTFIGTFVLDRMKDGSLKGIFNSLIEYVSGPILAFNYFLKNRTNFISPYFGSYTLNFIYNILYNFGIVKNLSSAIAPFMDNGYFSINVYTIYFRYIIDFGFLSCGILITLIGIIYGIAYKKCNTSKKAKYIIPIYSFFMYGIIMSFFEEKILTALNWYIVVSFLIIILMAIYPVRIKTYRVFSQNEYDLDTITISRIFESNYLITCKNELKEKKDFELYYNVLNLFILGAKKIYLLGNKDLIDEIIFYIKKQKNFLITVDYNDIIAREDNEFTVSLECKKILVNKIKFMSGLNKCAERRGSALITHNVYLLKNKDVRIIDNKNVSTK